MKFWAKNWQDDHATVRASTYKDGTTKLTIFGRRGQILCDATVCLSDMNESPAEGCVFIRDYGDTVGVKDALQAAGVLGTTRRIIETGAHTRDPLLRRAVHECPLITVNPNVVDALR